MHKKFKKALMDAYNFPQPARKKDFFKSLEERQETERHYFRPFAAIRYITTILAVVTCLNVYNYYDGFFESSDQLFVIEPPHETHYDENFQPQSDTDSSISQSETSTQIPDNARIPEQNPSPTEANSNTPSKDINSHNPEKPSDSTNNAVRVPKITTAPRSPELPVTGNVHTAITKPIVPTPRPVTDKPAPKPPEPQINAGKPVTRPLQSETNLNIRTVPRTEPAPPVIKPSVTDPFTDNNPDDPTYEPSYDPTPSIYPTTTDHNVLYPIFPCPTDPPVTTTTIITDFSDDSVP